MTARPSLWSGTRLHRLAMIETRRRVQLAWIAPDSTRTLLSP